jgi:hypothetical protein
MATLIETIRNWKEAQRQLSQEDPVRYAVRQGVIDRLVARLQRHRSLADLATGYYADGQWWLPVVREFSMDAEAPEGEVMRDAAYYQRLLQLRRPGGR